MRVLVTGGAGFIGSKLVDYLSGKGYGVSTLDVRRRQARESLPPGVRELIGDITRRETICAALRDIDLVFHLASLVTQTGVSQEEYRKVNVEGTRGLLKEAQTMKVRRFVYCSTDNVSGRIRHLPAKESDACFPENIYGTTKYEAERVALEFQQDIEVVIARPTRVYGPRDMRMLQIFKKIKQKKFSVVGKGNVLFHPVYVDDVLGGLELCAVCDNISGEVFYLGGESPLPLKDFLSLAARYLETPLPRFTIPVGVARAGLFLMESVCSLLKMDPPFTRRNLEFFVRDRAYDITRAKKVLGYKPEVGIEEGIRRTVDWYRQEGYL